MTSDSDRSSLGRIGPRLTAAFVLIVGAAACHQPPAPALPYVPSVSVRPAVRADSTRELRLSGSLEAERSTTVSFSVLGTVEEVLVQEGDAVERGQILARVSPRTYEDALGIAKVTADRAEDAYRRLEPMYRNQTLPEVKMVEVEAGRKQARLSVSMARKSLEDTVLTAREPGVVAKRLVEPGANVAPGTPVLVLVQTTTMLAAAPVPEMQVSRVKKGDATRVTVAALGKTFEGVVRDIAVIADPLTRTYEIKVALPNPAGELRVGMVADVRLSVAGQPAAVVVPPEAVRVDETGTPCVFVVTAENTLQRRQVEVAGYVGEGTALSSGMAEGELVVTSGTPMLADGMTVRVETAKVQAAQP